VQQKPDAFMVTVIKEPAKETTVADVIIGSLGITGLLVLLSLVLAGLLGLILVRMHRRAPFGADRLPPVSPTIPEAQEPESSRVQ
jgi:hypothetical protein